MIWKEFGREHFGRAKRDGIVYDYKSHGETNIVLYDRALTKVTPIVTSWLIDCRPELAAIIDDFDLLII